MAGYQPRQAQPRGKPPTSGSSARLSDLTERLGFSSEMALEIITREDTMGRNKRPEHIQEYVSSAVKVRFLNQCHPPIPEPKPSVRDNRELNCTMVILLWLVGCLYAWLVHPTVTDMWIPFLWLFT